MHNVMKIGSLWFCHTCTLGIRHGSKGRCYYRMPSKWPLSRTLQHNGVKINDREPIINGQPLFIEEIMVLILIAVNEISLTG